jgi:dTMP kinase
MDEENVNPGYAPCFLVFEGPDGVGKSTQCALAAEWLENNNIACQSIRDPGSSPIGEDLRSILISQDMGPQTEISGFLTCRTALIEDIIVPSLQKGYWLVCDRFTPSTLVYQGLIKGRSIYKVKEMCDAVDSEIQPLLTVLMDAPFETLSARLNESRAVKDKFESDDSVRYMAYIGYKLMESMLPGQMLVRVDASGNHQEVFEEQVVPILERLINIHNKDGRNR